MDDFSLFILIVGIATILFIAIGMRKTTAGTVASGSTSADKTADRQQMADDIRLTKTSRVVDEVSILDELSATSPNFRQYCELVGTSQREGGVTAPYSRKQVAYYEIRCYRIENHGAGDVETLVAHEKSFDPFYFTDGSCDTPVYLNIDSFGENVILINSTNHVEGPNSDFAKAMDTQASTTAASASGTASYAVAAGLVCGVSGMLEGLIERLPKVDGLVLGPQLALAGGPSMGSFPASQEGWARKHILHAQGNTKGGKASIGGARPGGSGARFSSSDRSSGSGGGRLGGVGGPGLGDFLGTGFTRGGGFSSVPRPTVRPTSQQVRPTSQPRPSQPAPQPRPRQRPVVVQVRPYTYRRTTGSTVLGDMMTGMVLSTILDSMASSNASTTTQRPTSTLRGYRLVEDVVPLGSPVYCIGEIYHHGTDVYMGRSLAEDYPTSFFATKPEMEVLTALDA